MLDPRFSENEVSGRDIPSFIEPRPPLILNPFMRPRPQKGTNLLELFEEDSECEESELVQVYLRLKPCNTTTNLYEVRSERCLITSLDTTTAGHGRRTQHNVSKMYTFSHIFKPESSQREIFEHVVKDNLKKLPEGRSFTLLTYGASGSGKTFTLMGTVASPGLVPRSLEYVFNIVEASQKPLYKPSETGPDVLTKAEQEYELQWVKKLRQISAPLREKYRRMSASLHSTLTQSSVDISNRTKHYVWVSFIEIYNEGIYDLLVPCDRRAASKLAIREDSSGNVYVKGATQAFVRSGEEAYDVMVAGKHNLQVAATGVHAQSSRSHCVFTITMLTEIDGEVRSACVRLCDLAGCERAARTRNTGARMQESRAINSSLHVLERCLHTLRRRQAGRRALVPYRESKLTRLLGAGLSGARGEAVSMVVTLNPAPEYAHETRHVLQLAAVARDIQVNNTLSEYPSTLETTQDTTVGPGAEVMKLRADNELLRFELARSEAWYKEQLARVEEQHSPAAPVDMWALVEEAKQITKEYYEDLICTLQKEKNEMVEEHENEVNQLLMNITVLEEKLSGEKLARARAEEEVVHLRACIEERDEKSNDNKNVIAVIDSDNSDGEDDPFNESLEPTFKKEDINRSRLTRQSLNFEDNSESEESADVSNESAFEKSRDTLKDPESDNDSAVDSTYATGTETSDGVSTTYKDNSETVSEKAEAVLNKSQTLQKDNINEVKDKENMKSPSTIRTTYFVTKENSLYESSAEVNDANNISYNVPVNNISDVKESIVKEEIRDSFKVPDNPSTFVNSIINSLRKQTENNNSLDQFERLEKEANEYNETKHSVNMGFENIKILQEKRHFFNDGDNQSRVEDHSTESTEQINNKKSFFDDVQSVKVEKHGDIKNEIDDFISPSIVREECLKDFEPQKSKQLLYESVMRPVELIATVKKSCFPKKHDSLDVFDSPQIPDKNDDQLPSIDDIRRSIAKVNLSNKNNQHKNLNDAPISADKSKHFETIKDNYGKSAASDQNVQLSSSDSDGMIVKELLENVNDTGIGDSIKLSESKKDFEVTNVKEDNTLQQFEDIYKDITAPRATDFDLLISQNETQINEVNNEQENEDDIKYNLRNKSKTEKIRKTKTKCMEQPKRRNLRLRRKKNLLDDDSMELDKDEKLKDIANLQTEFSDITMDVPARKKNIQDIPSPEKEEKQEENIPPMLGIQSCPSKLSTRGRRKLFTPRVEPLEESIASAEADERIRVPRPSYHRPKARRKL